jgi:hypothetical protein
VEDAPAPQRPLNLIAYGRVFEAVGATSAAAAAGAANGAPASLAAAPAALHFAGFTPGAVHTRSVRLVNTSASTALRAHVVPPETPFFKVWAHAVQPRGGTWRHAWRACTP